MDTTTAEQRRARMETFRRLLHALGSSCGYSQKDIADAAGISESLISKFKGGRGRVGAPDTVEKMSKALDGLIGADSAVPDTPDNEAEESDDEILDHLADVLEFTALQLRRGKLDRAYRFGLLQRLVVDCANNMPTITKTPEKNAK